MKLSLGHGQTTLRARGLNIQTIDSELKIFQYPRCLRFSDVLLLRKQKKFHVTF